MSYSSKTKEKSVRHAILCVGSAGVIVTWLVLLGSPAPALAQLTAEDIAALQAQGERDGWTFTVGRNPATELPLEDLCGLVEPENWQQDAVFDPCTPMRDLPPSFDWRDLGGCTPVRDQRSCGSCWAFATAGALECNILIVDNVTRDLSEQWLVSCNREGWGCGGGWWAHNYHQWKTDPCGGTGAVLESSFPYTATNAPCKCPYPHRYLISGWAFVGSGSGVPSIASMKQAIMDYGPISVAVYVDSAFQGYTGGIFNACTNGTVNHAVVLVGWNDADGGYWIMRNSWGPSWGEGGYMRIKYNCSRIGYAACYVDYQGTPPEIVFGYPNGQPQMISSTGGTFRVDVLYDSGSPVPDTGVLYWSTDGSNYQASPMTQIGSDPYGHQYEAHLPAADCFSRLYWYVGAQETTQGMQYDPRDAPAHVYSTFVADGTALVLDDPFEIDHGWTVYAGATSGNWERADPEFTSNEQFPVIQPEFDHTIFGSKCFVTGAAAGANANSNDVDGGPTHLISPVFNLSCGAGTVSYWRWFHISGTLNDALVAAVSNDNGNTWVTVETVDRRQEWTYVSWQVRDYLTPTSQVRVRFSVTDTPPDSLVEALIDDFRIDAVLCDTGPAYRPGDLNCDGQVNFGDINPFVLALTNPSLWQATYPGCPIANGDINNDGAVDFGDINPFVTLLSQ
jgi:hypothetical protein